MNQGSIFQGVVLAIEIMHKPQSNLEEKVNPSILKDDFSSKTNLFIFTSIAPVLLDRSNKASCFSSTEINKPLPAPVHHIRFKFISQFQLLPKIRYLTTGGVESSIISIDNNTINNIIRELINIYIRESVGPRIEP